LTLKSTVLRIDMVDVNGNKLYATYDEFQVSSQFQLYKLSLRQYSGTAGQCLQVWYHSDKG